MYRSTAQQTFQDLLLFQQLHHLQLQQLPQHEACAYHLVVEWPRKEICVANPTVSFSGVRQELCRLTDRGRTLPRALDLLMAITGLAYNMSICAMPARVALQTAVGIRRRKASVS